MKLGFIILNPRVKLTTKYHGLQLHSATEDIDPDWYSTGSNEKCFKFELFSSADNVSVGKAFDWGSNGR